jgi:hypothetical protein
MYAEERRLPTPSEAAAQRAALEQIIMRSQAASNPPPMRLVTGAGVNPGYVLDPNAMNAYQRQLYLPQATQSEGRRTIQTPGYAESVSGLFA